MTPGLLRPRKQGARTEAQVRRAGNLLIFYRHDKDGNEEMVCSSLSPNIRKRPEDVEGPQAGAEKMGSFPVATALPSQHCAIFVDISFRNLLTLAGLCQNSPHQ